MPAGLKLPESPVGIPESFDDHFKIMFDLEVLAFRANITRVATMMYARTPAARYIRRAESARASTWPRTIQTTARTWTGSRSSTGITWRCWHTSWTS